MSRVVHFYPARPGMASPGCLTTWYNIPISFSIIHRGRQCTRSCTLRALGILGTRFGQCRRIAWARCILIRRLICIRITMDITVCTSSHGMGACNRQIGILGGFRIARAYSRAHNKLDQDQRLRTLPRSCRRNQSHSLRRAGFRMRSMRSTPDSIEVLRRSLRLMRKETLP